MVRFRYGFNRCSPFIQGRPFDFRQFTDDKLLRRKNRRPVRLCVNTGEIQSVFFKRRRQFVRPFPDLNRFLHSIRQRPVLLLQFEMDEVRCVFIERNLERDRFPGRDVVRNRHGCLERGFLFIACSRFRIDRATCQRYRYDETCEDSSRFPFHSYHPAFK